MDNQKLFIDSLAVQCSLNGDTSIFSGVVLDESSILKNFEGATKKLILDLFQDTPYKLACTATPSPNDPMELGNHSEFLDVMSRNEMLAMYFVHDGGETAKWRLKGHATKLFYLQLDTIERAIHLYTNEGDTVFTPFMGIGSEVYQAVKMNRKGIGFELKESYYDLAKKNLAHSVESKKQLTLI